MDDARMTTPHLSRRAASANTEISEGGRHGGNAKKPPCPLIPVSSVLSAAGNKHLCVFRVDSALSAFAIGAGRILTQRKQRAQRTQRFFNSSCLCVHCDLCVEKSQKLKARNYRSVLRFARSNLFAMATHEGFNFWGTDAEHWILTHFPTCTLAAKRPQNSAFLCYSASLRYKSARFREWETTA